MPRAKQIVYFPISAIFLSGPVGNSWLLGFCLVALEFRVLFSVLGFRVLGFRV